MFSYLKFILLHYITKENYTLKQAVKDNDLNKVIQLVSTHNSIDDNILNLALYLGHIEIVNYLLQIGYILTKENRVCAYNGLYMFLESNNVVKNTIQFDEKLQSHLNCVFMVYSFEKR